MNNQEKTKKIASPSKVPLAVRIIFALLFLTGAVFLSRIPFFQENPMFGVSWLAPLLMYLAAGLLGFFVLPRAFVQLQYWIESLISVTVSQAITDIWDRQIADVWHDFQKRRKEQAVEEFEDDIKGSTLLDTSVLIDGRILEIYKTKFICGTLVVPKFVLEELQLVADNDDPLKRKKGRRGLDILRELKRKTKVIIPQEDLLANGKDVDKALVNFAKKYELKLMTLDFNLNKVAAISGVDVLNINELANALRPVFLPGETLEVKIMQEGTENDQGVGYLKNGTMVVVKGGKEFVGKKKKVEVSKLIQSPAGLMVFGKVAE